MAPAAPSPAATGPGIMGASVELPATRPRVASRPHHPWPHRFTRYCPWRLPLLVLDLLLSPRSRYCCCAYLASLLSRGSWCTSALLFASGWFLSKSMTRTRHASECPCERFCTRMATQPWQMGLGPCLAMSQRLMYKNAARWVEHLVVVLVLQHTHDHWMSPYFFPFPAWIGLLCRALHRQDLLGIPSVLFSYPLNRPRSDDSFHNSNECLLHARDQDQPCASGPHPLLVWPTHAERDLSHKLRNGGCCTLPRHAFPRSLPVGAYLASVV